MNDEPAKPKPSLIQIAFPNQATAVFVAALVVGFALIALPLIFTMDASRGDLILCAGIGIVLAAFGGQATVQVGGFIMAGAAAISVGIFIYLQSVTKDHYTRGSISGVNAMNYDLVLKTRNNILGSITSTGASVTSARYDFVVFKSELDADSVEIQVGIKGGDIERGNDKVARVANLHFEKHFGTNRRLDWELRPKIAGNKIEFEVWDKSSKKIISAEDVASTGAPAALAAESTNSAVLRKVAAARIIDSAHAQNVSHEQISRLVEQLKSDDTTTRRTARAALATLSPDSVPVLIESMRSQIQVYRVKLGIAVALSDMLRKDKTRAPQISKQLSDGDLDLLLTLTGDPDRTVRIYATQFMSELGDPRQTKLGLEKALNTSDEKAVHNQLLSIQQSIEKVPTRDQPEINRSLNSIRSKSDTETQILIDKLQQKNR